MMRWPYFPLGLLALAALPLRAADEPLTAAWHKLASHLPGEAGSILAHADAADPRARALAQAVAQAVQQPATDEKLRAVEQRLNELAAGGPDEIAAAARYFAGRLYQVHFSTPDPVRAAGYYRQLAAEQPASEWAQLGLVKLGLLTLYALPEPATPAGRIAAVEALLPRVQVPRARRDLFIVLARGRLFYEQPLAAVLTDLLAADAIGGLEGVAQRDFLLQVGELSFRAGAWRQAQAYFTRYLADGGADPRLYAVRERMKTIAARLAEADGAGGGS